ncbi:MAG: hypothetical protein U1E23_04895 [Reyranellaceae bacterium]
MSVVSSSERPTGVASLVAAVRQYVRSPSTRLAAFAAALSYACYAYAHGSWGNPALIGVSVFTGLFLPTYSKLSNKAELWANNRFGYVTAGRLGRFAPQFAFNLTVFWILLTGGALKTAGIQSVGGFAAAALLTTMASQGVQYLAVYLTARGVGDLNRNVLVGLSVNLVLAGFGTAGVPFAREAFLVAGFGFGLLLFGLGLASDARSVAAPKGGIGLFFGTFNPFHNTHLVLLERAMAARGLDKVIIHPTLIPRIHADAFRKGELRVARLENGFQIYEKTEKADLNVDYFPSGRQFLPPETRKALIELAVAEAGMGDRVEVAFWREIYDTRGFQGVIAEIRRRHPGQRLHGLHGTDAGGMTVRNIYDECGWIYPWRMLRRDQVSATAIRRGAKGMTARVVTDVLEQLTANVPVVTAGGRRFQNDNGVLTEGD